MSDNQRNNYDIDTSLDLLTQLDISDSTDPIHILITHDYFSTDSNYGRSVLKKYIHALAISVEKDVSLILADKGVTLLEDDELLNDFMLLSDIKSICVSSSSIDEYGVNIPDSISCTPLTDSEFISELLDSRPISL